VLSICGAVLLCAVTVEAGGTFHSLAPATVEWILLADVVALSLIAVRWVTVPLRTLANAAEKLGEDINHAPLPEQDAGRPGYLVCRLATPFSRENPPTAFEPLPRPLAERSPYAEPVAQDALR